MIECNNCTKSFTTKKHMKRHAKKCVMSTPIREEIIPADKINEIMEAVFRRFKYYSCCLPAALMFYEQIERFGIHSDVNFGFITCESEAEAKLIFTHFWNVVNEKIYDPSLAIARGEHPDLQVEYYKGQCIIGSLEDDLMVSAYQVFKATQCTDLYFAIAPEKLLKIRSKIHERVSPVLEVYNKNNISNEC